MRLRPELLPALAAFEAAARHQNFAHAGEELNLTASAVSHHVRRLEQRLGTPLFQRHARGVTLNAEGRRLADAASGALSDLDEVLGALRDRRDGQEPVRISTLHSLLNAWLMPRLPAFAARHPGIRLSFDTGVALARFDEGGPDLAVRHGPGHWEGMSAHRLMDDTLFPLAPPALAARVREAADIAHLPRVTDLAQQGWHEWFRAAGVHGVSSEAAHVFSDSTDALDASAVGLGVVLARQRIAEPWLRDGRLQRLPGPALPARWQYYVVHPAHRRPSTAAQAFIDWLLDTAYREA